jgi:hypothetical protein
MLRTLDTTHLTLRTTLLIRSFFSSSSSSSSSSTFKTITTTLSQSQSHSFLPLSSTPTKLTQQQQQHASFSTRHFRSNFGSSVIRCVSSFPTLDWNDAVSCSEVDADATHDDRTLDQDSKPAIPVRAFFFSTRYINI